MNKVLEDKKMIAKQYMEIANKSWEEITNDNYLCYSICELASETIYKMFKLDMFNDIATYYKEIKNNMGYVVKILFELEENVYMTFDIVVKYGIDIPYKINNGKFRIMKQVPKGYKDIWELLDLEEEEE